MEGGALRPDAPRTLNVEDLKPLPP
jgi:hypothetical protein